MGKKPDAVYDGRAFPNRWALARHLAMTFGRSAYHCWRLLQETNDDANLAVAHIRSADAIAARRRLARHVAAQTGRSAEAARQLLAENNDDAAAAIEELNRRPWFRRPVEIDGQSYPSKQAFLRSVSERFGIGLRVNGRSYPSKRAFARSVSERSGVSFGTVWRWMYAMPIDEVEARADASGGKVAHGKLPQPSRPPSSRLSGGSGKARGGP